MATTLADPHYRSVFVVGTLFSGSTLIGRDLTTYVQNTHYVGELLNYTRFPVLSHHASGECSVCGVSGRVCPYFTDTARSGFSHKDILGMHAQLARSFRVKVVIDGSKYVAWLQTALEQRHVATDMAAVSVLLMVRNPVAFALSYRERTGQDLWQGAEIWRDTYVDALRTINTHGVPMTVLRYEDYMADPDGSRRHLAMFLGESMRKRPDPKRIHDIGGNWSSLVPYLGREDVEQRIGRMRGKQRAEAEAFVLTSKAYWNNTTPRIDTRWHHSLSAGDMGTIIGTPGLADIAVVLGYNLVDVIRDGTRSN